MKVVHLAHYYWPHVGGIEKHLELLAKALAEKQCSTVVLTKKYKHSLPTHEKYGSADIHRFRVNERSKLSTKLSTWNAIWQHKDLLFSADHIHVHDVFWWLLPLLPELLFLRKKITITFHGYEGAAAPRWNQKFWHRFAELCTWGNLCIGGFHKKYYGVTPTLVSFGAVEPVAVKKLIKKSNSAVFIGRLEEDTGILEYLRAIKLLKDAGEDWSLDIYGEGSQRVAAELFVKQHNLSRQVTFFGFVAGADTVLSKYSVAFVSRYLAILEALLAEVPVVAQYTNMIKKEYLLRGSPFKAWISVAQTAEDIVTALQQKKEPSSAAKRWAAQQTWEKMANTYLTLWKKN